ncbi:MAG: DUF2244 domain-containing protein [Tepidimonas sp.]|nr:DUF2244 domain-containing protein [Tepidimonas sp.]
MQQGVDIPAPGLRLAQAQPRGWRWQLRRNGALTPRQFVLAMVLACGTLASVSTLWVAMGAVLVLPFAVLELIVVVWAFGWMARHAADREELELDEEVLRVTRWDGRGRASLELPRPWLRVEMPGPPHDLVGLRAGTQRIEVGRYVRPEVRWQLARELRWALTRSPRDTVSAGGSG